MNDQLISSAINVSLIVSVVILAWLLGFLVFRFWVYLTVRLIKSAWREEEKTRQAPYRELTKAEEQGIARTIAKRKPITVK